MPGHWEDDQISGSGNTHMAALVERASQFVMLVKVEGKDTNSVVGALKRHIQALPMGLMRSLTWDRGTEMAQHKQITLATISIFTSVTHKVRGNVARTKTPTACCANTFPRKPLALKPQPID